MSSPIQKCAKCHLRVEGVTTLQDGKRYCRTCSANARANPKKKTPAAAKEPAVTKPATRPSATRPASKASTASVEAAADPVAPTESVSLSETLARVTALLDLQHQLETRQAELVAELESTKKQIADLHERTTLIHDLLSA